MRKTLMAGLLLLVVGCASHPAPNDQVASSLAAVRGAEEAGAAQVPEAALHLKLAQEQIDRAKQLIEDDDNKRAEDLAVRAYQDAELALALAREQASKQRLEEFANANKTSGGEQTTPGTGSGQITPGSSTGTGTTNNPTSTQ